MNSVLAATVAGVAALFLAACGEAVDPATTTGADVESDAGATAADPNVVATVSGAVRGETVDGVRVFRGIPYAAPPVGELRWKPPEAPASWDGVRDALSFGTACFQPRIEGFYDSGEIDKSEDCLYLNVWSRAEPGASAPVMVWIHGGALLIGHSHLSVYDGAALTEQGVVVVSMNYRLGLMGFLAHAELSEESEHGVSGNYGILDQIAALEWVRDNIAGFGGDPDNVTIFGESAGSWSVCHLYASRLASGLFHKAIGQSGGCFAPYPQLAEDTPAGRSGHAAGASLGELLGDELLGAADLAALRSASAETLYAKVAEAEWQQGGPVYEDGHVFDEAVWDLVASGRHNRVPVLVGYTADEGTTLFMGMPPMDEDTWRQEVAAFWGDEADAIIAAYAGDAEDGSFAKAQSQIQSDQYFAWQMRTWARAQTAHGDAAWLYYFSHAPDLGGEYGTSLGAFHAAEIAYAFDNPDIGLRELGGGEPAPPRDSDLEVARLMSGYWTNFARSGDPNGPGLPHWPRYETDADNALEISAAPRVVTALRKDKLDAMDRFYAAARQAPPADAEAGDG